MSDSGPHPKVNCICDEATGKKCFYHFDLDEYLIANCLNEEGEGDK